MDWDDHNREVTPFGWWLFGVGLAILLFAAGLLATATVTLWFGGVVPAFAVPLATAATSAVMALWVRRRFSSWPTVVLVSMLTAAAALVVGSGIVGGTVLDTTFDGQWYHQEAVIRLAEGWNPVQYELQVTDYPDDRARIQLNGYPKASWLWGATLYRFTGMIEHAKALSAPLMVAAFAITAAALIGLGRLPTWLAVLTAAAATANPVAITQSLNTQLDGDLSSTLLIAISALVLAARTGRTGPLAVMVMAIAIAVNLKLTAAAFAMVILGGGLLVVFVVDRRSVNLRLVAAIAAGFVIGGLVVGFHPYVTNIFRHGHPLYPIMGPDKHVLIAPVPVSRIAQLVWSVFSTSHHFHRNFPSEEALRAAPIKIPFTVAREEIEVFVLPDVRVGGWGPLFGGACLFAASTLMVVGVRSRRWLQVGGLSVTCLVVAVIILPHPWFARLVPHGWLAPLVVIPVAWACGFRLPRVLATATLATALVNVALVTVGYVPATVRHSALIKDRLQQLRLIPQPAAVNLHPFPSNRARLNEMGVVFTEDENPKRQLQVILGRHQPKITGFTSQPDAGALFITWEEIPEATGYSVGILKPPPAGPGGGALTAVSRTFERSPAIVPAGNGTVHVMVAARNLLGCGPPVISDPIVVTGIRRLEPRIGHPENGSTVPGGQVLLSWLPVESGADTKDPDHVTSYLVEVVDGDTGTPVAAAVTHENHLAAQLPPGGDWLARVAAQELGSSLQFHQIRFRTGPSAAPMVVIPRPASIVPAGEIELEWTDVPGVSSYEYFVTVPGRRRPAARGTTTDLSATITLEAVDDGATVYHAIARACFTNHGCRSGRGWGPWSSDQGRPPLEFTVVSVVGP